MTGPRQMRQSVRSVETISTTRLLLFAAVAIALAACSNSATTAPIGDTSTSAAESAPATHEATTNTSTDEDDPAAAGEDSTIGHSTLSGTYQHLPESFSPDACDVVYTLMDELAGVIGDASHTLSTAQIQRLLSTQTIHNWDADEIEKRLINVTLSDQDVSVLGGFVGRGYGIHHRHLWVWDWLHRECADEFGDALNSMPERKSEMRDEFQNLDDLCIQVFRWSANPCHTRGGIDLGLINIVCLIDKNQGRECSALIEDGALVAGVFSVREP